MAYDASQIPWTDDQWARIEDVIQQEANSARVAATFLPLFGPLPTDADFVRKETIDEAKGAPTKVDDTTTVRLATLEAIVELRAPQIADPELSSALQLFRRAANVVGRLEDLVVFRGLKDATTLRDGTKIDLPGTWRITELEAEGLWNDHVKPVQATGATTTRAELADLGKELVSAISGTIGELEDDGQFGPFAVVLGHKLFTAVQTPDSSSLVLPQDSIIPFLGGGTLLRSSALGAETGLVVALGGAPVDLVVARDMALNFLTVTQDPKFVFRVFEKIALRIKQSNALRKLELVAPATPASTTPASTTPASTTPASTTPAPAPTTPRRRSSRTAKS
jgi:uncharacterized linocin/CFP29 family protein